LKYQDRSKWSQLLIQRVAILWAWQLRNHFILSAPSGSSDCIIACSAKASEKTIGRVFIFSTNNLHAATPVIELNRAIASFYVWDKGYALEQSQQIKGLENYLYYA
jgi:predicted RNA polymerase sigma factor